MNEKRTNKTIHLDRKSATDLENLVIAMIDEETGMEINNPKPLVHHSELGRPLSLQDQIKRLLRSDHVMKQMYEQGAETYDEANDFDIGDSFEQGNDQTPYTVMEDDLEPIQPHLTPSPSEPDTPKGDSSPSPPEPDESPAPGSTDQE